MRRCRWRSRRTRHHPRCATRRGRRSPTAPSAPSRSSAGADCARLVPRRSALTDDRSRAARPLSASRPATPVRLAGSQEGSRAARTRQSRVSSPRTIYEHAAEAAAILCQRHFFRGDLDSGRAVPAARAVEFARRLRPLASAARALPRPPESLEILDGASRRARARAGGPCRRRGGRRRRDSQPDALNTIGMARVHSGDAGGIEDLERSVERAESLGLGLPPAHAPSTTSPTPLWQVGRLDEGSAASTRRVPFASATASSSALELERRRACLRRSFRGDLDDTVASGLPLPRRTNPARSRLPDADRCWRRARVRLLARGRSTPHSRMPSMRSPAYASGERTHRSRQFVLTVAARFSAPPDAKPRRTPCSPTRSPTPDELASDLPLHLVELDRGNEYLAVDGGAPATFGRTQAGQPRPRATSCARRRSTAGWALASRRRGQRSSQRSAATLLGSTPLSPTSRSSRRRRTSSAAAL